MKREHAKDCHKWPATWLDGESPCTCGADDYNAGFEAGAKAEREACAALVEECDVERHGGYYREDDGRATLQKAAAGIRARQ